MEEEQNEWVSVVSQMRPSKDDNLPWKRMDEEINTSNFNEEGFFMLETLPAGAYSIEQHDSGGCSIIPTATNPVEINHQSIKGNSTKRNKKKSRKRVAQTTIEDLNAENDGDNISPTNTGQQSSRDFGSEAALDHAADDETTESLDNGWVDKQLHTVLLRRLSHLNFNQPTPIQDATLTAALAHYKDVIGAAETGSGKTLAFGLPVIQRLLERRDKSNMGILRADRQTTNFKFWEFLPALVITPTRELAMQVRDHLRTISADTAIQVEAIVGGIALPKQRRLIRSRPDIIVGTPGRLWDLIRQGTPYLDNLHTLQFLVLDEADRLLEKGHFADLSAILSRLNVQKSNVQSSMEELPDPSKSKIAPTSEKSQSLVSVKPRWRRQTFLFSATLGINTKQSSDDAAAALLAQQLTSAGSNAISKKARRKALKDAAELSPVEMLMARVGVLGRPAVVKVSRPTEQISEHTGMAVSHKGVSTVKDSSVGKTNNTTDDYSVAWGNNVLLADKRHDQGSHEDEDVNRRVSLPPRLVLRKYSCASAKKDSILYQFLLFHPGRALIFVNTINALRKVSALLGILRLQVFTLHAQMQQRQRLKSLDRFKASTDGILIATDVAAHGLDIPNVQFVVHYSLPATAEMFVHRSGRTARANQKGLALTLLSPDDQKKYFQILKVIQMPEGFAELSLDPRIEKKITARINIAHRLQDFQLSTMKESSSRNWLVRAAQKSELDLDEQTLQEAGLDLHVQQEAKSKGHSVMNEASRTQKAQMNKLKAQLQFLLQQPLVPKGVSLKYVASRPNALASQIFSSTQEHDNNSEQFNTNQLSLLSEVSMRHTLDNVSKTNRRKKSGKRSRLMTSQDVEAAASSATLGYTSD